MSSLRPRRGRRARRVLPFVAVLITALLVLVTPGANAGSTPWYEQSNPQAEDSEVNVTGVPASGETQDGEVRGLIDAHTHLMSNDGFGGDIVCGKTFSELGIEDALTDCDSHGSDGRTALIENLTHLEGKEPFDKHSTELWPSKRPMEILESEGYPGVISSHSWMDKAFTERIYKLGGFVAQYGNDARSFVEEGAADHDVRDEYGVGYGFGMDMNGFGGTPPPRADAAEQPLTYPFAPVVGDGSIDRQVTGDRVWDYNKDGVAHYGMVPDWVEDMTTIGGQDGQEVVDDLLRGPESYLRTWENTATWQPDEDLTKGANASSSSVQWSWRGAYTAGKAIDDRRATRWASAWGDDACWRVDFDTARQVSRITLDWETAHAEDYRIQTSLDGKTWQTVETVRDSDGGIDTIRVDPTSARQVRLVTVERATKYGVSLHEVTITS